jgi:signal transduction histidine kinase/CheY-like chemotaxis protein
MNGTHDRGSSRFDRHSSRWRHSTEPCSNRFTATVRGGTSEVQAAHPDAVVRFTSSESVTGEWDSDRLAQVVSNLLGNAIQHGGLETHEAGETVTLSVHNGGKPIPPSAQASIFEPLARGGSDATQSIGLFIARAIVTAHNSEISVSSAESDVPGILRDAVATVMPAADARGVRVETLIEPLTAPVSGDADRLQEIVWNLLSNGIKFTPRGGKVQLRLSRVNSHVEVTVSDTGRGISPDFLPFVFERFRQADATFTREHGRLGLGLAIAKQLAELPGGTITASSAGPDQGATFTVRLPLMIVHQPLSAGHQREHPQIDRRPPELGTIPRLDGIHVLAVDDEPDSLDLLRTVLEGAGATVSTARSGPEALDAIDQEVPNVPIADVGMPRMDGLQLIRAVRQMQEPARSIPAAALTAYARSQDRITSLASGFHMHLVKPIDPLELVVAVATLAPRRLAT